MKRLDTGRLQRLQDQVLIHEQRYAQREISRLQSSVNNHRNNASVNGQLLQMDEVANLHSWQEYKSNIDAEIASRKQRKIFNPVNVSKSMVKKDNPPVPPALNRSRKSSAADTAPFEMDDGDGSGNTRELGIKVIDGGVPRAWRPSDGVVTGATPKDTITDVSKTSVPPDE